MEDLSAACKEAVERGVARRVGIGEAIELIGGKRKTQIKAHHAFMEALKRRQEESRAAEQEANRRYHPFYIT